MQFKDLFSQQSQDYSKYRPTYPPELFAYLATLVEEREVVWDCATGNGQAALLLAPHFEQVWATDASEKQIQQAVSHTKIAYSLGTAEDSRLEDRTVNLTTVAQAFHWFRHEAFAREVKRVSKPGAALAVWCYELARISPAVDKAVLYLYGDILGPYWEKERHLLEQRYATIKMPFEELQPPAFQMRIEWSLSHLVGYLGTWSALQKYRAQNNKDPLQEIYPEIEKAWGDATLKKTATWDLALRVWRVNS